MKYILFTKGTTDRFILNYIKNEINEKKVQKYTIWANSLIKSLLEENFIQEIIMLVPITRCGKTKMKEYKTYSLTEKGKNYLNYLNSK